MEQNILERRNKRMCEKKVSNNSNKNGAWRWFNTIPKAFFFNCEQDILPKTCRVFSALFSSSQRWKESVRFIWEETNMLVGKKFPWQLALKKFPWHWRTNIVEAIRKKSSAKPRFLLCLSFQYFSLFYLILLIKYVSNN